VEHATSTRRTSEVRDRVPMGLNHTTTTVILIHVLDTLTLVLATSTRRTLVFPVRAMELDQTFTTVI